MPKRTDYVGQFIYENNTLKYVLHDEGRVIPKGEGWEYQYFIKDHLGNVRVTFTSEWESESVSATMEASNAPEEKDQFQGYDAASKVTASIFNHTRQSDTQSALRLSGPNDVSLAKTLSVMPGDTVRLEVFGKYVEESKENWRAAVNSAILSATLATSAGVPPDGTAPAIPQSTAAPFSQLLASDKDANEGVRAYLNYLVFDKDFKFVNGRYVNLSENAKESGSNVAHEQLAREIVIDQPGYVYAYLSNEQSGQTAYFDDFTITQVHSGIIQMEDYYPFGLTFNSYERENSVDQKYRFQGQEYIDDLGLGWDSFKWRNHQPEIGRFFNVDPLAEEFYHNSPYAFSENKVTSHIELEGLEAWDIKNEWNEEYAQKYSAYVGQRAREIQDSGVECTCEDFAVNVLIDFASENNLPVTFDNGTGTYDASNTDYTDIETFKNDVLETTGAADLANTTTEVSKTDVAPVIYSFIRMIKVELTILKLSQEQQMM